ncbi:hypothetical protein ABMF62_004342 [Salmonella enterica subsp. enterica serovar Newport]|nr:hypothetical protein [Salmonella enterica]EBY4129965.1 hypothetical protein [Salmonella enterica subsp. enterica serovar Oranienburg]ECD3276181.1 hypothetical protein [Salmonella enterica subsp. enterica serovar Newport]EBL7774392.1 hypothetical protein [Salmonella enterica]ECG3853520.1 hypothetical protein [Salmonella enterica subsp. enterica serovar Newport]
MNAQARGARAAKLYKRAKSKLISLDQFCVQKAREHKLPAWTGHFPVTVLTGILITAVIFGSLFFVSLGLLIFALILVTSLPGQNTNSANSWSDNSWGSSMRDGSEGFGLYTGPEHSHIPASRIDNEDDL